MTIAQGGKSAAHSAKHHGNRLAGTTTIHFS
jgi:hypothetical protein